MNEEDDEVVVQGTEAGVVTGAWATVGVKVPVVGAGVDEITPPPPPPPPPPPDVGAGAVTTGGGVRLKEAVTARAPKAVVLQVVMPVQPEIQPSKVESDEGAAVRETWVLAVTEMVQVEPQLRPLPEMVPVPAPTLVTARL